MTVAEAVGRGLLVGVHRAVATARQYSTHPLTALEEFIAEAFVEVDQLDADHADLAAAALWLIPAALALLLRPAGDPVTFVAWAVTFAGLATRRPPRRTRDGMRDVALAEARRAFVAGELREAEYERRVRSLLDPDRQRVREEVEAVCGVSPEVSAALAVRYRSVDALINADPADLEQVVGVGHETARDIPFRLAEARVDDEDEADAEEGDVDPLDPAATWPDDAIDAQETMTDTDRAAGGHDHAHPPAEDLGSSGHDHAQSAGDESEAVVEVDDADTADLSVEEIRDLRALADEALDRDSDVSLDDLESVPRDVLGEGEPDETAT